MSLQEIVVMGGGGDGLVVAEAVRQAAASGQAIRLAGFLDDSQPHGTIDDAPVLGRLDDWRSLDERFVFVPAIQKVRDMPRRAARIDGLRIPGSRWGRVIHPSAVIASSAKIGAGTYIAACATVQPGCQVGDFASLRAGAALGHHSIVERHGYVGANATLCGHARLCEAAHLGPNAVLLDRIEVGRYAVVGVGAAVTRSVADYMVVLGNPARRIGRVRPLHSDEPERST